MGEKYLIISQRNWVEGCGLDASGTVQGTLQGFCEHEAFGSRKKRGIS